MNILNLFSYINWFSDSLLLQLDGTTPEGRRWTFEESEIRIVFDSDGSANGPGFRINYGAVGESTEKRSGWEKRKITAHIPMEF